LPAQLAKLEKLVLDFILPQSCLGCGRQGELICSPCQSRLSQIKPPICARCGLPRPDGRACPDCSTTEFALDGLRSPFLFKKLMREAVHQFKYQNLRSLARPLAAMLAEYLTHHPLPAELLVPVPLHPRRLRQRGYNQSHLLAQELGRALGLRVASDSLVRTLDTPPQARTQSLSERRRNMAAAFTCRQDGVRGKSLLLIDDVATSGATLNACAAALKRAGAAQVWGLTLAREA
jgi:ComF family protein